MFCTNCGKAISEGSNFCPHCGEKIPSKPKQAAETPRPVAEKRAVSPLPEDQLSPASAIESSRPTQKPVQESTPEVLPVVENSNVEAAHVLPKKKSHKVLYGFLISFFILAISAGLLFHFHINDPLRRIQVALSDESFGEAAAYYAKLSDEEADKVGQLIIGMAQTAYDSYNNGEMPYENAHERIENLYHGVVQLPELDDQMKKLDQLENSKSSFEAASSAESDGDYPTAITKYEQVVEDDSSYENAQTKIVDLKAKYKEEIIAQAKDYAASNNFSGARDVLEASLKVLNSDKDISALKEEYTQKQQEEQASKALTEAESLVEKGDYPAAIKKLSAASQMDSRVTTKLTEYKKTYTEKVLNDAAALAEKSDYEGAISILEQAQFVVSASEISSKITEYKGKLPVSLLDLEPSGGDNCKLEEARTDIYGNIASSSLDLYVDYSWSTIKSTEYVANGKFKTFHGTIMVEKGVSDDYSSSFEIYVDDVLKYGPSNVVKKTEPTEFNVEITNAKFIKIVVKRIAGQGSTLIYKPEFRN